MEIRLLETRPTAATDVALLALRLAIGAWMLSKGWPKVHMLFSESTDFYAVLGMGPRLSLALTVLVQVVGSVLLMAGIFTRFAAVALGVHMLVAVVAIHWDDPFGKTEPALHFLLVYTFLLLAGAGKYSIDYLIAVRRAPARGLL